jgi:hypothetical protein
MKKSNIITVAICAFLLVAGGGVGAYAADQLNGDQIVDNTLDGGEIQNESLTGADVDNGTLTGLDIKNQTLTTADLAAGSINDVLIANGAVDGGEVRDETLTGHDVKDRSIEWQDLAEDAQDGLLANITAGGEFDEGALVGSWQNPGQVDLLGHSSLVILDVRVPAGSQPVQVTLYQNGTQNVIARCVASPTETFDGSCSAVRTASGVLDVEVLGGSANFQVTALNVG